MSLSTREREERQRSMETPDTMTPPDPHRSTGLSHSVTVSGSVRQRLTKQEHVEKAPEARQDQAGKMWAEMHERHEREKREAEATADRRNRELTAQNNQPKQSIGNILLAGMYKELAATPQEIERVNRLMRANRPTVYGDADAHKIMLLESRNALTGN
jgi:hypothetical protein